jgi:hypothetical protein
MMERYGAQNLVNREPGQITFCTPGPNVTYSLV